jgi:serine/threonine protein kinase
MLAGTTLGGRYRLDATLGRGGMGEVWRGVDLTLDRPVAVKLLSLDIDPPPELEERFRREAQIAARLQHPGITVVFDFGVHQRELFLVMELLKGGSLAQELAAHPTGLPIPLVYSLAEQIARALSAAHSEGIVHRDLKPANVMLLDAHLAKICDFGIARIIGSTAGQLNLTATGSVLGTPTYMAPEQIEGHPVDGRTDLYALGCVLHELLTGRPPFEADSGMILLHRHLTATPSGPRAIRPDVPPALDRLVLDLLAKDPQQRPADALAVVDRLRLQPQPQGSWTPPPPADRPAQLQAQLPTRAESLPPAQYLSNQPPPQYAPPLLAERQQQPMPSATPAPPPYPSAAPEPRSAQLALWLGMLATVAVLATGYLLAEYGGDQLFRGFFMVMVIVVAALAATAGVLHRGGRRR